MDMDLNLIFSCPDVEPDENGDITLTAALNAAGAPPVDKWGIETFVISSKAVGSYFQVMVPRRDPIVDCIECVSGNAKQIKISVGDVVIQSGLELPWQYPLPMHALTYNEVKLVSTDGPFTVSIRSRYCGCTIYSRGNGIQIWDSLTCIPQVEGVKRIMARAESFYAFDGPSGPFKTRYGMISHEGHN